MSCFVILSKSRYPSSVLVVHHGHGLPYGVSSFGISKDKFFTDLYLEWKVPYCHLRRRIQYFIREHGESRFMCDGVWTKPWNDIAGGPHRCALLADQRQQRRYEDWDTPDAWSDAPDARSGDGIIQSQAPPSYRKNKTP